MPEQKSNSDPNPSKKPDDSDFQQQRLKAWQPLLTPAWVISTFIAVGIIFIPIGAMILIYSDRVVEIEIRYDNLQYNSTHRYPPTCVTSPPGCQGGWPECQVLLDLPGNKESCSVDVPVTVTKEMKSPVFFYYKLSNYYQNHRRYVKSRSDVQLRGDSSPSTSNCDPLTSDGFTGKPLYPCGLVAGSIFSDVFSASVLRNGATGPQVLGYYNDTNNPSWQKRGIAWNSDVKTKFGVNDAYLNSPDYSRLSLLNATMPRPDDEDLIVWMRTAGLPTFKKLYRKLEDVSFNEGDVITVKVLNYYPVSSFSGQKAFVFSTTSWLGGKNSFLGWAYITVGIICICLALIFFAKHIISPRKPGNLSHFDWRGPQPKASSN